MASQSFSRADPRDHGRHSLTYGQARGEKRGTFVQRLRAALRKAHRQRMRFEIARHKAAGAQVRPELEHSLSWRFGVPVR